MCLYSQHWGSEDRQLAGGLIGQPTLLTPQAPGQWRDCVSKTKVDSISRNDT